MNTPRREYKRSILLLSATVQNCCASVMVNSLKLLHEFIRPFSDVLKAKCNFLINITPLVTNLSTSDVTLRRPKKGHLKESN